MKNERYSNVKVAREEVTNSSAAQHSAQADVMKKMATAIIRGLAATDRPVTLSVLQSVLPDPMNVELSTTVLALDILQWCEGRTGYQQLVGGVLSISIFLFAHASTCWPLLEGKFKKTAE